MRSITTIFAALLAICFMSACSKESPPPQEAAKPAVREPQPSSQPSREMKAEAKQQFQETVGEVKQEAKKEFKEVKKEAAVVADAVKTTAGEAVAIVKQEVSPPAAPVAAEPVKPASKGPDLVTYAASMGKVTFRHAEHASRLACGKCHPSDPPQKLVITKAFAHSLCKGCHQASGGQAPTACAGCHKK